MEFLINLYKKHNKSKIHLKESILCEMILPYFDVLKNRCIDIKLMIKFK